MSHKKFGPGIERTFIMVKPDGVQRGLVGDIITRFEKRGLKIVAMKMIKPGLEHIDEHYPKDETWIARLGQKGFTVFAEQGLKPEDVMGTSNQLEAGKQVREWLVDYLNSAPVVAMVIEGIHAIDMARKIAGPTLPSKAEIGTIRGDFSTDSPVAANLNKRAIKNVIHISENKEEAEHEMTHWFSAEEIFDDYNRADQDTMY